MRAISGAIVVLAGAIVFSAGILVRHADTQLFVCAVGGLLALVGLYAWVIGFARKD
jgi:hypothetical protein